MVKPSYLHKYRLNIKLLQERMEEYRIMLVKIKNTSDDKELVTEIEKVLYKVW